MKKYRFIVMALLLIFVNGTVYALSVSTTSDPNVLVNNILGSGLTAVGGSPTYSGDAVAAGTFTGGISSGIGIDSGILFSTGAAADAVGPNTNGYDSSEVLGGTGTNADAFDDATRVNSGINNDAQLNALAGVNTYDGAILEFNFTTSALGNLSFNFVFGSEEYIDFTNRGGNAWNDVFGFFLDGLNIALVPGTINPISIDTINPTTNSSLYINNVNPAPYNIEYDGFTTVLVAQLLGLVPGTHSMKLAIADGLDSILDAAVFIQAGSFSVVADGTPPPISEPATLLLFGSALAGFAGFRRFFGKN